MAQELSKDALSAPLFRSHHVFAWASGVSLASSIIAFWMWTPSWEGIGRWGMVLLIPFLLPYGFITLRVCTNRLTEALSLALAIACALFVPAIYVIVFVYRWDRNWWILSTLILAFVMQPVMVAAAIKTYYSTNYQQRAPLRMRGSVAYGLLLFGLLWTCYSPVPQYLSANESSARRYLERVASAGLLAEMSEHRRYRYPEALGSQFHPKCAEQGLFPQNSPDPERGYVFDYRALPPSIDDSGCKWYSGFTMTARPAAFGKTGVRSYFVSSADYSVHFTSENRSATPSDPIDYTMLKTHRPQ